MLYFFNEWAIEQTYFKLCLGKIIWLHTLHYLPMQLTYKPPQTHILYIYIQKDLSNWMIFYRKLCQLINTERSMRERDLGDARRSEKKKWDLKFYFSEQSSLLLLCIYTLLYIYILDCKTCSKDISLSHVISICIYIK